MLVSSQLHGFSQGPPLWVKECTEEFIAYVYIVILFWINLDAIYCITKWYPMSAD